MGRADLCAWTAGKTRRSKGRCQGAQKTVADLYAGPVFRNRAAILRRSLCRAGSSRLSGTLFDAAACDVSASGKLSDRETILQKNSPHPACCEFHSLRFANTIVQLQARPRPEP